MFNARVEARNSQLKIGIGKKNLASKLFAEKNGLDMSLASCKDF